MLLAIDLGNTNAVFAVFDEEKLLGQWRISTSVGKSADEYAVWLLSLLQINNISPTAIKAVILSSVVPEANFAIEQFCKRYFNLLPLLIGSPDLQLPIKIMLKKAQEVGADRLVNAIEAWRRYKKPMIIVDFGTATTFDVVDCQGNYIGGVIAPGVNLSLAALRKATAKLPNVQVKEPEKVIGTSTVTAMQSGIYFGYVGLVEGIVRRIAAEYGMEMKVIATGGLASLYATHIAAIEETVSDLTLNGLNYIYNFNIKREEK